MLLQLVNEVHSSWPSAQQRVWRYYLEDTLKLKSEMKRKMTELWINGSSQNGNNHNQCWVLRCGRLKLIKFFNIYKMMLPNQHDGSAVYPKIRIWNNRHISNLYKQVYLTFSIRNKVGPDTDNAKWKHEATLALVCTSQEEIAYLKKKIKKNHHNTSNATGSMPTTCILEAKLFAWVQHLVSESPGSLSVSGCSPSQCEA